LEYHLNSTYKKICPMDLKGALTKKGACTTWHNHNLETDNRWI
jgi:hypothetical protein